MSTAGVVLAAGDGTRFTRSGGAGHKLLADLRGRRVLHWAIDSARQSGLDHVYVVTGAVELTPQDLAPGEAWSSMRLEVLPGVVDADGSPPDGLAADGVTVLRNERWTSGLASSLQVAVEAAHRDGHDAVVVALGDQPFVEPEAWRRVGRSSSPIAIATYDGARGHPVRLAAELWPLLPTEGDVGARDLMRQRPDIVSEVPCPGHPGDIDTVADLDRLAGHRAERGS